MGDPALRFSAHNFEFNTCVERGDLERAKLALEQMQLIAHELDQPTMNWFATFNTAGWELMHGDLVAGERLFESALQIGQEAGQPDAVFTYAAALAHARIYQGRAQRGHRDDGAERERLPGDRGLASRTGSRCSCYLDRGAEAAKILEQAASDRFEHIAPNSATLTALALYAEAAVLTDSSGPASILYELIEPWADQVVWNGVIGYGHARMWLGLLAACMGDHERADQHLAFACDFQETHGLLLWAARAHLGWAEALAGRGDAARAREHAARALELSREHGFGALRAARGGARRGAVNRLDVTGRCGARCRRADAYMALRACGERRVALSLRTRTGALGLARPDTSLPWRSSRDRIVGLGACAAFVVAPPSSPFGPLA